MFFFFFSSLPSWSLIIKRYCSTLLRIHCTWESDLQWNHHQVLRFFFFQKKKIAYSVPWRMKMKFFTQLIEWGRTRKILFLLFCCSYALPCFVCAEDSSFLFFDILITSTFFNYCCRFVEQFGSWYIGLVLHLLM